MSSQTRYRINAPHVISEIIEGEAVILNFESGSYYSLNESGMTVWEHLQRNTSEQYILLSLQKRYDVAGDTVAKDLKELLRQLSSEQLIVPDNTAESPPQDEHDLPVKAYVKPSLEKFTDLQELLLLDPIHDVDESGWPHHSP